MLWEPPTDQEKRIMKEFRDVFRDIVKADADGLLYVRDIRDKIRSARAELPAFMPEAEGGSFIDDYLQGTYGIKLSRTEDGAGLLPTYEIVDEHKYLIFMMKF